MWSYRLSFDQRRTSTDLHPKREVSHLFSPANIRIRFIVYTYVFSDKADQSLPYFLCACSAVRTSKTVDGTPSNRFGNINTSYFIDTNKFLFPISYNFSWIFQERVTVMLYNQFLNYRVIIIPHGAYLSQSVTSLHFNLYCCTVHHLVFILFSIWFMLLLVIMIFIGFYSYYNNWCWL